MKAFRFGALALALVAPAANAEIVKIVIDDRKPYDDPDNKSATGPYEVLRGRLFGEVDPKWPGNALIQDIDKAPRNARGRVEYISTFTLIRPADMSKYSGVLINALPNRGNRLVPSARRLGAQMDPIFYDRGYAVLWVGWQGDLPDRPVADKSVAGQRLETISVPVAKGPEGQTITGDYLIRVPAVTGKGPSGQMMRLDQQLGGALAYAPASYDTRQAVLTGGAPEDPAGKPTGKRTAIAPADWQWWNCKTDAAPLADAAPADLCVKRLKGSFNPDESYTFAFKARDPLVLGLGFAATRDAVSFFRLETEDHAGNPNPMAGKVLWTMGQGVSQVGNFVRTFIALGFNTDEKFRRVWDGAHSHIGGRMSLLNYRFAQPGASTSLYMPGTDGVLWWGKAVDGHGKGLAVSNLDRCKALGSCPVIMESFGAAELWNQRMTTNLVNYDLKADIPLPDTVRRYYFPATSHGGGVGGFRFKASGGECTMPMNPNPEADQVRALTIAMADWISTGKEPPPSLYPTLAKGDLVRAERGQLRFPAIGSGPEPYGLPNPVNFYDFGPDYRPADVSGIVRQPAKILKSMPAMVPQVDKDGNEMAGARSVQLMAPLGTYTGWNTQKSGPYADRICSFIGGFIPFAATAADRAKTKDPRPSIEERYKSRHGYVDAVRAAVAKAQAEGLLLAADGDRLVAEAVAATDSGDLSFLVP